jgi:hypothetical protein
MPDVNNSTPAIRTAQYWKSVAKVPLDVPLWLLVKNAAGETYKLPFPCTRTQAGWFNSRTGAPLRLAVQPTHWLAHFDLERTKALEVAPPPRFSSRSCLFCLVAW